MYDITKDYFLLHGREYTLKIIEELKLNYSISRIDGSYIINVDKTDYISQNWLSYFFYYDHCCNMSDYILNNNQNDNKYHLEITDFSNENWRNYKKLIRKEKIKKIDGTTN